MAHRVLCLAAASAVWASNSFVFFGIVNNSASITFPAFHDSFLSFSLVLLFHWRIICAKSFEILIEGNSELQPIGL